MGEGARLRMEFVALDLERAHFDWPPEHA